MPVESGRTPPDNSPEYARPPRFCLSGARLPMVATCSSVAISALMVSPVSGGNTVGAVAATFCPLPGLSAIPT